MKHRFAGLIACTALALSAHATDLQVQVQDEQGKPLADAAVFLESRDAKALTKPLASIEMAQINRQFVPTVLIVPTGTPVSFPNRDKVRHHVYSFSPIKKFELKLFAGTPANPVVFDKSGIAVLGCNIHDNMAAWVVVVDTPYYANSDKLGFATLSGVPAGTYHLRVWHPRLAVGAAAADQTVVVGTTTANITYKLAGLTP